MPANVAQLSHVNEHLGAQPWSWNVFTEPPCSNGLELIGSFG
jgi:hypothetical protein